MMHGVRIIHIIFFNSFPLPTVNEEWDTLKTKGDKTTLDVEYTVKMPLYQRVVEVGIFLTAVMNEYVIYV